MNTYGTVLRTEQVSPHLVRVVLGGPGLDGFVDPEHADSYVNAQFPTEEEGATVPRRCTVRRWDTAARELSLDFVTHGDDGVAGPWAQRARPGDQLVLRGPAGGYSPDPRADAHLMAGDASALPAVAAALERLDPGVPVLVVLEVPGADEEITLSSPGQLDLRWVHGTGADPELLARAVAAAGRPPGDVQAFVHGEAESVRAVRRVVLGTWEVPRERTSISPYWRHGHTDEQWRQVKGAWTREVEQDALPPGDR